MRSTAPPDELSTDGVSSEREEAEMPDRLRQAWREGLDSGDADDLDFAVLKQEARKRLAVTVRPCTKIQ